MTMVQPPVYGIILRQFSKLNADEIVTVDADNVPIGKVHFILLCWAL